jgi:hypothetical protein
MDDESSEELFEDVEAILRQRGHKDCKVHYVYGPGDPEATLDPFGKPATTVLFQNSTGTARTGLIYTEAYYKQNSKGEEEQGYRTILVTRDGWLAVVE